MEFPKPPKYSIRPVRPSAPLRPQLDLSIGSGISKKLLQTILIQSFLKKKRTVKRNRKK